MVDILTKQTTNQEFLDFAVEQVHNADIVTTHAGEPSAQVCDLLLNKNGKLYIATSSQNPFFKDLIAQPKVIVDGYKGDGTMDYCGFSIRGTIKKIMPACDSERGECSLNIRKKLTLASLLMILLPIAVSVMLCVMVLFFHGSENLNRLEELYDNDNGLLNVQTILYNYQNQII